jgi:hypothetical protein
MNWQHCNKMAFVGLSDSYEQFYQAVRRCWRFGQEQEVDAHIITSSQEGMVVSNIERKERDSIRMAGNMVKHMKDLNSKEIRGTKRADKSYKPKTKIVLPKFI